MLEKQIQKKIIDYLKSEGHYVVKTMVSSHAGVPDILTCVNGVFVGIEVKSEKGITSVLQLRNMDAIKQSGGISFVARSVDDVKNTLNKIEGHTNE